MRHGYWRSRCGPISHSSAPGRPTPSATIPPVKLVVTDMAVIEPTPEGLVLRERAPGVSIADIIDATPARLLVPGSTPEMTLS